MSFTAKYRDACEACTVEISPGQEVEFTYNRRLVHVVCPEALDSFGVARPVCPRCFCEIPTSGVCGVCDA